MSAPSNKDVVRASVSYRRLVWKSNRDAVPASWRFFGRANDRTIRYEKLNFNKYGAKHSPLLLEHLGCLRLGFEVPR